MAKQVTVYVHVADPEGNPVVLKPGDELPDWAEAQVTNPACFDEPDSEPDDVVGPGQTTEDVKREKARAASAKARAKAKEAAGDSEPASDPAAGEPAGDDADPKDGE